MTELDMLREQLRVLIARAEISDMIDRFSRDLDDYTVEGRPFDVEWVRAYFTDDAHVDYPPGSASGAQDIAALIGGKAMAPFQRTHHVTTNYVIDLASDANHASVRFNLIATHVYAADANENPDHAPGSRLVVGDYYESEMVHTGVGWRFSRQKLHVVWSERRTS